MLLSSAKLVLQEAVESSALTQDAASDALVLGDFPQALQDQYAAHLRNHRLRPEIIGTVVANQIVNRMGLIHPFELAEEEGAGLDVIGAAFVAASSLLDMPAIWHKLDTAPMPEEERLALFDQAALALRGHMADLIRASGTRIAPAQLHAQLHPMITVLTKHAETLPGSAWRGHGADSATNAPQPEARREAAQLVARLFALDGAIGLSVLSRDTGIAPAKLANGFIELGRLLGIDWAQSRAAVMSPEDPWERLLVAGLARDFQQMRLDFLGTLAQSQKGASSDPKALIESWAQQHISAIAQFRRVIARAQATAPIAPAMLAQIASQARNLLKA